MLLIDSHFLDHCLAVRIIGEITPERINVLQQADQIVRDEILKNG